MNVTYLSPGFISPLKRAKLLRTVYLFTTLKHGAIFYFIINFPELPGNQILLLLVEFYELQGLTLPWLPH